MNNSPTIITAIRGPVMLMTLGGVMAMDHFGQLGFWKTWPVLLIVLGLFKLLERVFSSPTAPVSER